jgi:hypothetical protein
MVSIAATAQLCTAALAAGRGVPAQTTGTTTITTVTTRLVRPVVFA